MIGEQGVGIAFKVTDGDAARMNDDLKSTVRVRPAVSLEILRQLKVLSDAQLRSLSRFRSVEAVEKSPRTGHRQIASILQTCMNYLKVPF